MMISRRPGGGDEAYGAHKLRKPTTTPTKIALDLAREWVMGCRSSAVAPPFPGFAGLFAAIVSNPENETRGKL